MSSVALALSGLALAIVVFAPALAHFAVLPPLTAFRLWLASVLPALAAIVVALLAIVLKRGTMPLSGAAIAMALVPVILLVGLIRSGSQHPRINDITTDLEAPPAFTQAQIPVYPDKFKPRVRDGYKDLAPILRDGTRELVFDRAVATAKELGWDVTFTDAAAGHLEAVSTSKLWNFRDDVVVRVREEPAGGKVRVDVRSRSRDGEGDFGVNAARIRAFAAKL